MYWKKTGDLSMWKGIAQDAIVMNLDDLLCVGVVDNILLSSTIGRNKNLVPGDVIAAVINGTEEMVHELRSKVLESCRPMVRQLTWATSCAPSSWIRR